MTSSSKYKERNINKKGCFLLIFSNGFNGFSLVIPYLTDNFISNPLIYTFMGFTSQIMFQWDVKVCVGQFLRIFFPLKLVLGVLCAQKSSTYTHAFLKLHNVWLQKYFGAFHISWKVFAKMTTETWKFRANFFPSKQGYRVA